MAEINLYGEIHAETVYPCRMKMHLLDNPGDGIGVYFTQPYSGMDRVRSESPAPVVQLRAKQGAYALFYLTYNEDFDIEKLGEWWKDSELIWELKAKEAQDDTD